jgi:hypothetical protein
VRNGALPHSGNDSVEQSIVVFVCEVQQTGFASKQRQCAEWRTAAHSANDSIKQSSFVFVCEVQQTGLTLVNKDNVRNGVLPHSVSK